MKLETIKEIGRRYQSGESGPSLARKFNVSCSTIYKNLKSRGIPRFRREIDIDRMKRIIAAVDGGRTYQDVGDEFGVTKQRIEQLYNGYRSWRAVEGNDG